jgi:hypothetical protein
MEIVYEFLVGLSIAMFGALNVIFVAAYIPNFFDMLIAHPAGASLCAVFGLLCGTQQSFLPRRTRRADISFPVHPPCPV